LPRSPRSNSTTRLPRRRGAATPRPNIVFILADDLGWADLGCYGARLGECGPVSPHLDRMAAAGLRFTHGYSNSPVCSPTRFALLTGRWQYRLRGAAEEPLTRRSGRNPELIGLPPEHPTLPSQLRAAGYRTALVGKWHLGYPPHFGPLKSGYDEFFGPISGAVDYHSYLSFEGQRDLWDGEQPAQASGYLTDVLSDRACDFIRRRAGAEPFLLSLHYTAPHWPWETRDDAAESARIGSRIHHVDGGSLAAYQRMVQQMDEGIGRVLQTLAECGIADDTIVVFTSDNGGERFSDMWPFVGKKMDLLEGGLRVPLIARWPRAIAAGGVTAQPMLTMDWMPTLLEAAGASPHADHPPDGLSMLAVLRDPAVRVERPMFWRMKYRDQCAAIDGDWKYLRLDGHEFLYNIAVDARERANLAEREPARLAALKARYAEWSATMPPIPDDAAYTLVYGPATMAMASG
jgi:arylsulfatase A-like enzyme